MPEKTLSERWEKAKVVSQVLATLLMPVVLVLVGHSLSSALKEREAKTKFIELAISILREEPRSEDVPIREWALEVVDRYSEIKIEEKAQAVLLSELAFPRSRPLANTAESLHLPAGSETPLSYLLGNVRLQFVDSEGAAHISITPWSEADLVLREAGDTQSFKAIGRTWIIMLESVSQPGQTAGILIFQKPEATMTTIVEDPVFE